MVPVGVAAALGAAVLWSACAQCFGAAGLRIGSVAVNHVRLVAAVILLLVLHVLVMGTLLPQGLSPSALYLFAASGVVGLAAGDACGFRALVLVGPGITTLVMTTVPALAALMAFAFLGERVVAQAVVGMVVTTAGVGAAAWGKSRRAPRVRNGSAETRLSGRALAVGLLFALGGAAGQAGGVVLAKPALADASALSGTLVRVIAGMSVLWGLTLLRMAWSRRKPAWTAAARADREALLLTRGGALTGPVFGVWLSQVATKHAQVAVAATLMSTTPLFVLVEEWLLGRGRPLTLEFLGAAVAIGGVALLVLA